jgi:hypothetical protein
MSDTACVLCSEDWDTCHIRHDEPLYVQKLYFAGKGCPSCQGRKQRKKSIKKLEFVGHKLMQEEGEITGRLEMLGDGSDEKSYEEEWYDAQDDFVVFTCEGCKEEASFAANDIYGYRGDDGKLREGVYIWHHARAGYIGERQLVGIKELTEGVVACGVMTDLTYFDDNWDYEEVHGHLVCMKCRETCDGQTVPRFEEQNGIMVEVEGGEDCDAKLFKGDAHDVFVSDTYDPGSSFYVQDLGRFGKTFCTDCYERLPNCSHCGEHWDFDDDSAEFIEEDDYRCKYCTSWKKCCECDQWFEELNDMDECTACAPKEEE